MTRRCRLFWLVPLALLLVSVVERLSLRTPELGQQAADAASPSRAADSTVSNAANNSLTSVRLVRLYPAGDLFVDQPGPEPAEAKASEEKEMNSATGQPNSTVSETLPSPELDGERPVLEVDYREIGFDRYLNAIQQVGRFFVVVETDEGLQGVGEGGITWREAAMEGFVQALTPSLLGEDPLRTEHLWQVMSRCGFFPPGKIGAAAISAIDIALWDIKAQALGVPLYQLLGGLVRERVVCYPHIAAESAAELAAAAREKVEQGWKFVRFDLPSEGELFEPRVAVRRGIEQFAAVREAVGAEIEIIMDVHTRLDTTEAITLCREIEPLRPYFIEDPVRSENASALGKLVQAVHVPIAMGEQYASKWEFRQVVQEQWIDFARIDLCIVGGMTEAIKVAHWCETNYIPVAPHNPLGPVSTAACLHLDLAISNFAVQECARMPGEVLSELFPQQVTFDSGYLLPPTEPGLGVTIDENAVKQYPPIEGGDCPRLQRRDGSFTNW